MFLSFDRHHKKYLHWFWHALSCLYSWRPYRLPYFFMFVIVYRVLVGQLVRLKIQQPSNMSLFYSISSPFFYYWLVNCLLHWFKKTKNHWLAHPSISWSIVQQQTYLSYSSWSICSKKNKPNCVNSTLHLLNNLKKMIHWLPLTPTSWTQWTNLI